MNVATVVSSLGNTGGVDTVVMELSKRIDNLHVLTGKIAGEVPEEVKDKVVVFENFSHLKKIIEANYDVVHFHYFPENFLAIKIKKPVVHTWHGVVPPQYFFDSPKRVIKTFLVYSSHLIAFKKSKKILSVSRYLHEQLGPFKFKSTVIFNGVDPLVFSPKEKNDNEKSYVLFVGALEKYRGAHLLPELALKNKDVDFLVIGRGKLQKYLINTIKRKRLRNLKILGYIPFKDIVKYFQYADIFIRPSLYEGFGIPVVEAMSCEIPVIANNIKPFDEIINNNEDGVLVSLEKFSDMITTLAEDRKLREKLGKNARKKAAKKFNWDVIAEEVKEVYEELSKS